MEKKKKPIEDEALDQVTGGDESIEKNVHKALCERGAHVWKEIGGGNFVCLYCNAPGKKEIRNT